MPKARLDDDDDVIKKPRRWMLWIVVTPLVVLLLASVALFLWLRAFGAAMENALWADFKNDRNDRPVWRSTTAALENELDVAVTLSIRPTHPLLAEYERRLSIKRRGQPAAGFPLPASTGGRLHMNLYVCKQPATRRMIKRGSQPVVLRITSLWDDIWINVSKEMPTLAEGSTMASCKYLGRFDNKRGPLQFAGASETAEEAPSAER